MTSTENRIAYRTCPLCEATCGLEITVSPQEQVVRIRGDKDDVFSHGFICPKGSTLKDLHEDPDRLRKPLVKRDGKHIEVSWEEAFQEVHDKFVAFTEKYGRTSLGAYVGNPNAHNLGAMLYLSLMLRSLGTRNLFSASSVDQMPKHVAGGLVFGTAQSIAVPDIDHTDYLFMLGANPYASNGSLCTAPDFPGRIQAIRARGGKVVVVDPRRTKTAEASDEWIAIRPGTDGLFLAAIINTVFAEGLDKVEPRIASLTFGLDVLRSAISPFTPERVADTTGINADDIKRIAREICAAPTAAVYGRMGVNTVEFGTTNAWLINCLSVITGNFDSRGGEMFTTPVAGGATTRGTAGKGKGFKTGRGFSRVSKKPEALGEYPVAVLGEEILTPGEGQIRGMVVAGGNPILSTPHSEQLDKAFSQLEFMVSIDIYLNETSRHADVILPPPSALEKDHYDQSLYVYAVRNIANYSPPVLQRDPSHPDEWEILAKLGGIFSGLGIDCDPHAMEETTLRAAIDASVKNSTSNIYGRDADEIFELLSKDGRRNTARLLDFNLQTGPFGAAFGAHPGGASLDLLLANPHGVDFGALEPRLPEALRTPSGKIEIAPESLIADLVRLESSIDGMKPDQMLLIGRRDLKSNNSWMHNIRILMKGSLACTAQVHPEDAQRLGLSNGATVRIHSRVGAVEAPVEVTDAVRQGVVSLPHGWGHGVAGTRMNIASGKAGVNSNVLTDDTVMDPLSGNAVLNAIPVTLTPV